MVRGRNNIGASKLKQNHNRTTANLLLLVSPGVAVQPNTAKAAVSFCSTRPAVAALGWVGHFVPYPTTAPNSEPTCGAALFDPDWARP